MDSCRSAERKGLERIFCWMCAADLRLLRPRRDLRSSACSSGLALSTSFDASMFGDVSSCGTCGGERVREPTVDPTRLWRRQRGRAVLREHERCARPEARAPHAPFTKRDRRCRSEIAHRSQRSVHGAESRESGGLGDPHSEHHARVVRVCMSLYLYAVACKEAANASGMQNLFERSPRPLEAAEVDRRYLKELRSSWPGNSPLIPQDATARRASDG